MKVWQNKVYFLGGSHNQEYDIWRLLGSPSCEENTTRMIRPQLSTLQASCGHRSELLSLLVDLDLPAGGLGLRV